MTNAMFTDGNGDRDGAKNIAIIITGARRLNTGIMQRRFAERRINANFEWCLHVVIGQCYGNRARHQSICYFDVGIGVMCI